MYCTTAYAVRQSSKGWSGIVAVADTKENAETIVRGMYRERDKENETRRARGDREYKDNYRVEEISYFFTNPHE